MRTKHAGLTRLLLAGAALVLPSIASAHPVTVDGVASEWSTRLPNADNLGIIARSATGTGEFIWRDAPADTRTDLATPEVIADIITFQATGDATGVAFLLRRAPGVNLAGQPIQVQIAIDTDRVDGSGQEYFAEFADTKVASNARWERLVETLFGSGGQAKVIDNNFNMVATAQAKQGATGDVEIFVPWSALGFANPPITPLRFTVATFRAQNTDLTIDIGGAMFSNALDAITDYGNPAVAAYPNTYADVQDQIVNYSFDLYFAVSGEVYAPLVVQRFLSNSSGGGADEWYTVKNVTPANLALAGFKIGDEETPDGNEGMFNFPDAATLGPGNSFTVARAGASYQAFFGAPPDAELPPGASMAVPDMIAFTPWTNGAAGTMQLTNAGDEVLVLGPSNTILDVAVFGNGAYTGVNAFGPAPGTDEVLTRGAMSSDTDDCQVDFSNAGKACTADAQCGGACFQCSGNVCGPKPMGAACPDANPCNGDEICNGAGVCVSNPAPICDDQNPCTTDGCTPANGCTHMPVAAGTSCSDGSVCNGTETCDAMGTCMAGAPLDCADMNPCTIDACDPAMGCSNTQAPAGADCSDADACNGAETCDAAGKCVAGTPLDCNDSNPCTDDTCDMAAGCKHVDSADGTSCKDADVCNGDEVCMAGACAAGTALDCDDKNACTDDKCDMELGCKHDNVPAGTQCDAGNQCASDACDGNGTCVAGNCGGGGAGGGGGGGAGGATGGSGGTTTTTTTTTTGTGATGGEGGTGGTGGKLNDGGCGCRVAGAPDDRESSLAWLATLAVSAAFLRRKRRETV
ncbi:MAG: MYXO-CTERM sorting domain-containing protein [Polyangiaceae bacterium]